MASKTWHTAHSTVVVLKTNSRFGPTTQTWTFDGALNISVAADGTILDNATGRSLVPQSLDASPAQFARNQKVQAGRRARVPNTTNDEYHRVKVPEDNKSGDRVSDAYKIVKSRTSHKLLLNKHHIPQSRRNGTEQENGEGRVRYECPD